MHEKFPKPGVDATEIKEPARELSIKILQEVPGPLPEALLLAFSLEQFEEIDLVLNSGGFDLNYLRNVQDPGNVEKITSMFSEYFAEPDETRKRDLKKQILLTIESSD